ncbi:MAG TPA: extracellular solute-binding protein, partial [Pseudonocardiaceae bacterium]|nr:extracellular solute-binding protein [Pseudonocardiaceae bacterium]
MRPNRLFTACLAAGLVLVAGCSAVTPGSSGGGVTLTYLTFETPSLTASFWDNSIAGTEKQVPGVTIKKIVAPSTDRDAYAKQLQASGEFPDLLQSITPATFAQAGLLKPYEQSWVNANFLDPMGNAYKGKVYIPPTNSQIIPMVFYNKQLFARARISTRPTTWAELMADCAKLKNAGITPMELGGSDSFAAVMPLSGILSVDVL